MGVDAMVPYPPHFPSMFALSRPNIIGPHHLRPSHHALPTASRARPNCILYAHVGNSQNVNSAIVRLHVGLLRRCANNASTTSTSSPYSSKGSMFKTITLPPRACAVGATILTSVQMPQAPSNRDVFRSRSHYISPSPDQRRRS